MDAGPRRFQSRASGATLMECVLAMALIAFALPAFMLALSASGAGASALGMEGHARRVIPTYAVSIGSDDFEDGGGRLAWAHAADGSRLGRLSSDAYQHGLRRLDERAVRFIVVVTRVRDGSQEPDAMSLTLEHPAAAPAKMRKRLKFQTHLLP